jgi:multiple sugar transport system permease protein
MVPLTAPTLTSVALLKFIGIWNSYIWPRLVNRKDETMQLISNWVMQGFADTDGYFGYKYGSGEPLVSVKMAAVCMVTLPLVILFICFRKYIMTGVSKSGTKG